MTVSTVLPVMSSSGCLYPYKTLPAAASCISFNAGAAYIVEYPVFVLRTLPCLYCTSIIYHRPFPNYLRGGNISEAEVPLFTLWLAPSLYLLQIRGASTTKGHRDSTYSTSELACGRHRTYRSWTPSRLGNRHTSPGPPLVHPLDLTSRCLLQPRGQATWLGLNLPHGQGKWVQVGHSCL